MNKYILLGGILFVSSLGLRAQEKKFNFGFSSSVDYNFYGMVDDFGIHEYKGSFNYSGGIVVKYRLNNRLFLGTKILYSTKNFKGEIDYSKLYKSLTGDPIISAPTPKATYLNKFIDVPLEIYYALSSGSNVELIGNLGLVNSFQIGSDIKSSQKAYYGVWGGNYNDYLLAAKIGFGIMKKYKNFGIYLEPQIRLYLNDVYVADNPIEKPIHLGVELQVIKL